MDKAVKIALAGEGGQGVQSVAMILTEAAAMEGKEILYIPNFGVEQRGGVSIAFVQIGDQKIGAPKFKTGDIVIALSDRAVRRVGMYAGPQTVFIYDAGIEGVEDDLPGKSPFCSSGSHHFRPPTLSSLLYAESLLSYLSPLIIIRRGSNTNPS